MRVDPGMLAFEAIMDASSDGFIRNAVISAPDRSRLPMVRQASYNQGH